MQSDTKRTGSDQSISDSAMAQISGAAAAERLEQKIVPSLDANHYFSAAVNRNLDVLRGMVSKVPDGDDPEVIHDVRVAIRRIRTCISLRTPAASRKKALSINRKLRFLFRMLGEVRDLDVLLGSVYTYYKRLGARRSKDFVAFVNDCEISRSKALSRVITAFHASSLKAVLDAAGELPAMYLDSSGHESHAVPAELDAAVLIASKYRVLLSFGPVLNTAAIPDETYHSARRASKRLRYSIEFFIDILGPGAARCYDSIKSLQDHLGSMNDTFFAIRKIMSFLSRSMAGAVDGRSDSVTPPGPEVARYLALRQAESRRLNASFVQAWTRVSSRTFRRNLFTSLGTTPRTGNSDQL
jgi:CHAD domain-containing protein